MPQAQNEELPRKRWWLPLVIAFIGLIVLAAVGWHAWRDWQVKNLTRSAAHAIDIHDFRAAGLALRRALSISPMNVEVNRQMARLAEELGSPSATDWRKSVFLLNPGSEQDALALATSALRQGRDEIAEEALRSISKSGNESAQYHTTAGAAALARGDRAAAAQHFAEAATAEPENARVRYNQALMQIQSPDPQARKQGAETLESLAKSGALDRFARRALVMKALRENRLDEALKWSRELQKSASLEFRDRLLHLDLLHAAAPEEVSAYLDDARNQAKSVGEIAALISWMRMAGEPNEALQWSERLDPKLRNAPPVAMARADALVVVQRWDDLEALTGTGNWGGLDFARLAFLARAKKELDPNSDTRARWALAIQAANSREQIAQLVWMARQWNWSRELKEALWAATQMPKPDWALQLLHRIAFKEGDTETLLRISQTALKKAPGNPRAKNNVAVLSVLLGRDLPEALQMAKEVYEVNPQDPAYVSTYASALYASGRLEEAGSVIEKLPEASRQECASIYAVILRARGNETLAAVYKEQALKKPLLPEEKALLDTIPSGASAR